MSAGGGILRAGGAGVQAPRFSGFRTAAHLLEWRVARVVARRSPPLQKDGTRVKRFSHILPFVRPYRGRLAIVLVGTALFAALLSCPPLVMSYYVDHVLKPKRWELLELVVAAIVLVPVCASVIRFFAMQLAVLVGRRFLADMRLALYEHVMALSMRYHSGAASGAVVGRIMADVNMLRRLITAHSVRVVIDAIMFCFALGVSFYLSWIQASVLCGILVLYLLVYWRYATRIRRATRLYRNVYDEIGGRLQETAAGVRQVRIFNREEWENEQFLGRTIQSLEKALEGRISSVSLKTACAMVAGYGSTVIIGLNAYFVLTGRMTFGELLAFDQYVWFAIHPAIRLTILAGQLAETLVSADRVEEVMREPIDIRSAPGAPRIARGPGSVEYRDVHFGYEKGVPLFEGLSLEVPAGATVALVGHTGCGKTTLTSLLPRYWDVQGGAVLVDGIDVRTVELRSLRRLFGIVLQDSMIFDGTLAENIAYGLPGATRSQIEEAARAAEILERASTLPQGLDSLVGTKGVKLSVGEKQRVSIARAILRDPEILVMDEATSALDSESEALIQKSLARVLEGRTSFVIAHRLSTIVNADMIVAMSAGRIVETGTHDELVARPAGMYRALYEELLAGGGEDTDADAPARPAGGAS
jgi:subfamily B ATP-binding cassette protein MsbA